jgi:aspartate kinase
MMVTFLLSVPGMLLLAAVACTAFVPPHLNGHQELTGKSVVFNDQRITSLYIIDNAHSSTQILYMAENGSDEIDEPGDDDTNKEVSPSEVISTYKSKISTRRTGTEARPGSSAQRPIDVTMKFGGSSLANAERIDHVANLIKDRTNPPPNEDGSPSDEIPVRPRAVICSAMGKTTNSLLAAGEMALEGRVDIEALRTLHLGTCRNFDLPERIYNDVEKLLNECEDMLNGVRLIQELSPKSLDQLVSYGERCSVRIMAARLNQIGVPAQAFDAWDVGVFTDETYGDAKLLSGTIDSIKERFDGRVDPNVVAVVTGFIGE